MNNITKTSAYLFTDNSNYGFTLDNIGSNRSIHTPLSIETFSLDQSGELLVILKTTNPELSDKVATIANKYPNNINVTGNQIMIQDTMKVSGSPSRNISRDGINYMIEGTFGDDGQPTQRAFGISINWKDNNSSSNTFDRSDEL